MCVCLPSSFADSQPDGIVCMCLDAVRRLSRLCKLQAMCTPVQVTYTPVQATCTPVQATDMPVQATCTPMQATCTPVQATGTPAQTMIVCVYVCVPRRLYVCLGG